MAAGASRAEAPAPVSPELPGGVDREEGDELPECGARRNIFAAGTLQPHSDDVTERVLGPMKLLAQAMAASFSVASLASSEPGNLRITSSYCSRAVSVHGPCRLVGHSGPHTGPPDPVAVLTFKVEVWAWFNKTW